MIIDVAIPGSKKVDEKEKKKNRKISRYQMGNPKALGSLKSFCGTCYYRSPRKCTTLFQETYGTNLKRVRDPFCTKLYHC